jgi:hypothetical protein
MGATASSADSSMMSSSTMSNTPSGGN